MNGSGTQGGLGSGKLPTGTRRRKAGRRASPFCKRLQLEQLEPRILLDGDLDLTPPTVAVTHTRSDFRGSNVWMSTPDLRASPDSWGNGTSVTLEMWFAASSSGILCRAKTDMRSSSYQTTLSIASSGEVQGSLYGLLPISLGTVTLGDWHHVALRYDGASQTLDGLLDGVRSSNIRQGTGTLDNSVYFMFGWGTTSDIRGPRASIGIWNVARTDEQIRAGRWWTPPASEPGLMAYYPLDDGSGNQPRDLGPYGRTGIDPNGQNWNAMWQANGFLVPWEALPIAFYDAGGMDAGTVTNRQNYRLVISGGDGTFGNGNEVDVSSSITSIDFDPVTGHALLRIARELPSEYYQVTLHGAGIRDQAGNALNGGADYVADPLPVSRGTQFSWSLDPASDTGMSHTDGVTNQKLPQLVATVSQVGRLELDLDRTWGYETFQDLIAPGTYTFRPPAALSDGDYALRAQFTPFVGIVQQKYVSVTVDTQPPSMGLVPASAPIPCFQRQISFYPDRQIDPATFTLDDTRITGPGGVDLGPVKSITGGVQLDPVKDPAGLLSRNAYTLTFDPLTAPGDYVLSIGPNVADVAGNLLDQNGDKLGGQAQDVYQDRFSLSGQLTPGLWVTRVEPTGDQRQRPFDRLQVVFSQPLEAGSFTTANVQLSDSDGTTIAPSRITASSPCGYELDFDGQTGAGNYRLVIGPGIRAADGTLLDQDHDGVGGEAEDAYRARVIMAATWITADDTSSDGWNLIVYRSYYDTPTAGELLTIDGVHTFGSLELLGYAIVAHSAATETTESRLLLTLRDSLWCERGAGIYVTGRGYLAGRTVGNTAVGAAYGYSGGSYGGLGTAPYGVTNPTYGNADEPDELGSGGALALGGVATGEYGSGGGIIQITATTALLDGYLIASGGSGYSDSDCKHGGSGGSILLNVDTLAGTGWMQADGGNGGIYYAGFGGGGRIAIYTQSAPPAAGLRITADGAGSAGDGTIRIGTAPSLSWKQPTQAFVQDSQEIQWHVLGVAPWRATVDLIVSNAAGAIVLGQELPLDGRAIWETATAAEGAYELRAVVHDATGRVLAEFTRTLMVARTATVHAGLIAGNETWLAGQVHVITDDLTVAAGAHLTIDPGVIVKVARGKKIVVADGGVLDAPATAELPILFTSLADDSAGGDTNGDGGRSRPLAGDWLNIAGDAALSPYVELRYNVAQHTGIISFHETWGVGVHVVTGTVTVPSSVRLTIAPGAVVKFAPGAGLTVDQGAELIAEGTLAEPIVFTSLKDDSAGGDANLDANTSLPAAGDWAALNIYGTASLRHTDVRYGGDVSAEYGSGWMIGGFGTVSLADSRISQSLKDGLRVTGQVSVSNCLVAGSDRGIAMHQGPGTDRVVIANSTLDNNRIGLVVHDNGSLSMVNSLITNSLEIGLRYVYGTLVAFHHNDVWVPAGSTAVNYDGISDLTGTDGNISVDPQYRNSDKGDFRLGYGSPAIDAADGLSAPAEDLMDAVRYDDPRCANTGLATASGAFADLGAYEFVEQPASDVDLVVSSVTGPSAAIVDAKAPLRWTITNVGSMPAGGPWHDAIYLGLNGETLAGAVQAAEFVVGTGLVLGPGQSATFTAEVTVPAGVLGQNYWLVQTNVGGAVFEATSKRDNNTGTAALPVRVDYTELPLDETGLSDQFTALGQSRWYKITMPAGQSRLLSLDLSNASGATELYAQLGRPPSRTSYDLRSTESLEPDQQLQLPATGGTFIVLAYADALPTVPAGFQLASTPVAFAVSQCSPATVGNGGFVTIDIRGTDIPSDARVQLTAPDGHTYGATQLHWLDSTRVLATLNLYLAAAGDYQLSLVNNAGTLATAPTALSVQAATGPRLEAQFSLPSLVRVGRPFAIDVQYTNTGDMDMPSPVLELTGPSGVRFGFDRQHVDQTGRIQFFAPSSMGAAGVLRAGQQETVRLYAIANTPFGQIDFDLQSQTVNPLYPSQDAVDWQQLETQVRPPFASQDPDWNGTWTVLTRELGPTWDETLTQLSGRLTAAQRRTPVLLSELLQDALVDALGTGGGLTDQSPLSITLDTPIAGADGYGAQAVEVIFSRPLNPSTFTADDLSMTDSAGNPVTGLAIQRLSSRLFRVAFPQQTAPGFYHLQIGPDIADLSGHRLDQDRTGIPGQATDVYEAGFLLDTPALAAAPYAETSKSEGSPAAPQANESRAVLSQKLYVKSIGPTYVKLSEGGLQAVIVTFNRKIDFRTFNAENIQFGQTAVPNGSRLVLRINSSQTRPCGTTSYGIFGLHLDGDHPLPNDSSPSGSQWKVTFGKNISDLNGVKLTTTTDSPSVPQNYQFIHIHDDAPPKVQSVSVHSTTGENWPVGAAITGPVDTIEVAFSEEVLDLDQKITITDPDGAALPVLGSSLQEIYYQNGVDDPAWIRRDTLTHWFLRIPRQSKEGDYTVKIGADLTDAGCLSDEAPTQLGTDYVVTFHLVTPQVVVAGHISQRKPTDLIGEDLTDNCVLALFEKVGDAVDVMPGQGDDYLLSQYNEVTRSNLSNFSKFSFAKDNQGQPIGALDPQENDTPRQVYLVVYAENKFAGMLKPGSLTTENHDGRPGWMRITRDANVRLPEWGQLLELGRSPVITLDPQKPGVQDLSFTLDVTEPLQLLQWARMAGITVQGDAFGEQQPRYQTKPVAMVEQLSLKGNEDAYDPAHDMLTISWACRQDPVSLWQAYAHALQVEFNHYQPASFDQNDFGLIYESSTATSAFAEGFAAYFAAVVWQRSRGSLETTALTVPHDRWRSPEFLDQHDYWMGSDAYGFPDNAASRDEKYDPASLVSDGINRDANTGDVVAGAVASTLWSQGLSGLYKILDVLGGESTLAAFAQRWTTAYGQDPAFAAALIDNGYPVAGPMPNNRPDKATDLGRIVSSVTKSGLVMDESAPGVGDWFRFHIEHTTDPLAPDTNITYPLNIASKFVSRVGDLDVLVYLLTPEGKLFLGCDLERGGDRAQVTVRGLETRYNYDFLVEVCGHGAANEVGPTTFGGDMNPDYTLIVSVNVPHPGGGKGRNYDHGATTVGGSADPNEMVGPAGFGPGRFVPAEAALSYTILFENVPTTMLPAQEVHVTATLDANLDPATFAWQEIGFGSHSIPVPDHLSHFSTTVDLRPEGTNLLVTIDARLDPASGEIRADLIALDPVTGQLVEDPALGFLPPDDSTGRGEGWLSYLVQPKAGLASGTAVAAQARIVFDVNAPLETNTARNTLDALAPVSSVNLLPPGSLASFPVSWAGQDDVGGSAISRYDVYVSVDQGVFQLWQEGTTATSATYTAPPGHTYAFYSLAADNVGHREALPAAFDAQTLVSSDWQNRNLPCDVTGEGQVTPLDVLVLIHYINSHLGQTALPGAPEVPPPFYNVNGDNIISPVDVLLVINYLNAAGTGEAEAGGVREASSTAGLGAAVGATTGQGSLSPALTYVVSSAVPEPVSGHGATTERTADAAVAAGLAAAMPGRGAHRFWTLDHGRTRCGPGPWATQEDGPMSWASAELESALTDLADEVAIAWRRG
ncbi:MAG: Ig-like domain-containing protein [Planctomycetota bacterium]|nr:Ig-like domain-containing protein [Planctomycetota bacterium]